MSNVNYGTYTMVDILNAQFYAETQVNKMKCTDPDIINSVCNSSKSPENAGGGTCLSWIQDESQRGFPKPQNYYLKQCSSEGDCDMGKCVNGRCVCTSSKDCTDGMECIPDPNNNPNLVCGYSPKDVASGHCIFNNEQACLAQGKLPYTCTDSDCTMDKNSKYPYTEWAIDEKGDGKCIVGNFALRQWCENPISRCAKDSNGNFPSECQGSSTQPGVTDVPPFFYDRHKSMCYMTHDYCNVFGREYTLGGCNNNSDCGTGYTCVQQNTGKYCTGIASDCQKSAGEKAGEFFLGNTLFYMLDKGVAKCKSKEEFTENRKLLGADFGGKGINLYLGKDEDIGFDIEEVKKVYPGIIKNGKILIEKEDLKDVNIKRIYLTMKSKSWIRDLLISNIKNRTKMK